MHVLSLRTLFVLSLAFLLASCGARQASAPPPARVLSERPALLSGGRLPRDIMPLAYTLELEILPGEDSFSGRAQIVVQLTRPTDRILLHAKALVATSVQVHVGQRVVGAQLTQLDETGLAELTLAEQAPAGSARIEIAYRAPFDKTLTGLYKVQAGGEPYAFTQFEPTSARLAFPCFDEPAFKTPFEVWLTVRADHQAISNTREVMVEMTKDGKKRMRFAPTKPLPTYLIAFAVGPLDIVDGAPIAPTAQRAEPLALRGIAPRGQGERLRFALEQTGPLLTWLEQYTRIGYPYPKLDLIAVPDFSAGAMENAGAITFRDWLILIDPATAPEHQKRAHAEVNAHELAHHWFGNLVTMPYWDDLWLNEAFATWMGHRTVQAVLPDDKADIDLLGSVLGAMDADSKPSARRIREPILGVHDIANAFDGITYNKGAGVLSMFERYLGPDVMQSALSEHLRAHAHGIADATQLLAMLSKTAGKDVSAAMGTFLDQPGVPLIEAKTSCEAGSASVQLKQRRYMPLGLDAPGALEQRWQVPICVRYEAKGTQRESCMLLAEPAGSMPLETCPTWIFPSAGASGYYRFALDAADLKKLEQRGIAKLSAAEKLALADSLQAGFANGALGAQAVLQTLSTLAGDDERAVATAGYDLLELARDHALAPSDWPRLEKHIQKLYGARVRKLGFSNRTGEDGETRLLRLDLVATLAALGREPGARGKLGDAGVKYLGGAPAEATGVSPELLGPALVVALQDRDPALFDAAYQKLVVSQDPAERSRLLGALAAVQDGRSARALELTFDPALRTNEVLVPLRVQLGDPRTRDAAYAFLEKRFDDIVARIGKQRGGGNLMWLVSGFCNAEMAGRIESFFAPRAANLMGGPRALAGALEGIKTCTAQLERQRAGILGFFGVRVGP
jgi:alanyl aminopeptidase